MSLLVVGETPAKQFVDNTFDYAQLLKEAAEISVFCANEAASCDSDEGFPRESFRLLAKRGLLAAPVPIELGGFGLAGDKPGAAFVLLQLLKLIGRGNLAVGRVFEGHVNALLLILLDGNQKQIETFAADVRERHQIFGVWNTEAAGEGVTIEQIAPDRFRLKGSKIFASGAGFVERPIVNAAFPDGGWQMTIVPMEAVQTQIDSSWWRPLGMRATRSFKVDFTDVELTNDNLLGAPGDYYLQPWFSGGAIRFAAVQLGGAEALLDETRKYLQALGRLDDPYQKGRVGEMAIRIESGNLWLNGAAAALDRFLLGSSSTESISNQSTNRREQETEKLLAYANMMRTAIEQICLDVIALCERSVGARGLMRPHPIERIVRDLTIYLRQPAPDAALADVGRFMLQNKAPSHDLWR